MSSESIYAKEFESATWYTVDPSKPFDDKSLRSYIKQATASHTPSPLASLGERCIVALKTTDLHGSTPKIEYLSWDGKRLSKDLSRRPNCFYSNPFKKCVKAVKRAAKAVWKFLKKHKRKVIAIVVLVIAVVTASKTTNQETPSQNSPPDPDPSDTPPAPPPSPQPITSISSSTTTSESTTPSSYVPPSSWTPPSSSYPHEQPFTPSLPPGVTPPPKSTPTYSITPTPSRPFSSQTFLDPDSSPRVYSLTPTPRRPAHTFHIEGKQLSKGAIGGINGMGNSFEDAHASADYFHKLAGNHQIEWVFNNSNSLAVDVLEASLRNFHGAPSKPEELLKANWIKFHEQHKNDPSAKYLQYCHSQGAIYVKNALLNLPQEIRDRMIIVAIAPATVIPKRLCHDSFNYASKSDPIPLLEASMYVSSDIDFIREELGAEKKKLLNEIIWLDPHPDAHKIDHNLNSPTFMKIIKDHIAQYLEGREPEA